MFPTINSGSPILEDTKICKIVTSFGECSILSYCLKDDEKFTTNILGYSNLNCQSYRKVSLPRGHGDDEHARTESTSSERFSLQRRVTEPSVAVAGGRTHTGARPKLQRPRARDRAKGTHGEQHRRSMKLPVHVDTTTEVRR